MIDLRIYRAAFLPTLVAIIVLMFSVEAVPPAEHPPPGGLAVGFDARQAAAMAREIVTTAPDRTPGSSGDAETANTVATELGAIASGSVSNQEYSSSFDDNGVTLRNVIVTLPGTSDRTVVVLANRDTVAGPDSPSTASATGTLVQLAEAFAHTRHQKTLIFVSTDGGSDGASGARQFLDSYPTPELIDAFVVISQPGPANPSSPHVVAYSAGPQSTAAQLVETAKSAVENETSGDPGLPGLWGSLFALALPSGLGEQAALIDQGADAVTISGAGERPLHGSEPPATKSIAEYGRAAFAVVSALDQATTAPIHGPSAQLMLGGNLIPGWPLSLLALTLLLPAAALAVDGLARASRRGEPVLAAVLWGLSRTLPFACPVLFAYLLSLVGIAPAPDFPFDPARFEFGWRAGAVIALLIASFVLAVMVLRPLAVPAKVSREVLCPALGVISAAALLGIWLLNPYLALLLVPFGHLWILGARPSSPVSLPATVVAMLLAAIPMAAALVWLVERLHLGIGAPWQLVLMMTGGQIPVLIVVLGCVLAGSLLGSLAVSRAARPWPWVKPAV